MRSTGVDEESPHTVSKEDLSCVSFAPKSSGHQVSSAESRPENCSSHSEGKNHRIFPQASPNMQLVYMACWPRGCHGRGAAMSVPPRTCCPACGVQGAVA